MPENKKYKPIQLTEDNELIIWGVVEYVIKKYNQENYELANLNHFS